MGKISGMFGHRDKEATTDEGNPDPNQGLTDGQLGLRKGVAGALSGLGRGLNARAAQRPQGNGGNIRFDVTQPNVDLGPPSDYLEEWKRRFQTQPTNNNAFYGV